MIEEDQVAGLFAAEVISLGPHGFHHVAVSDLGPDQMPFHLLHGLLQAHIGHDRSNQRFFLQLSPAQQLLGTDGHDMIAIDNLAVFIADNQPVAVAVECQPDIGAQLLDLLGHDLRVQGPAFMIDVFSVRSNPDSSHLGPEFGKDMGRDFVGGSVRAVEHDVKIIKGVFFREGMFEKDNITTLGIIDA